MCWLYCSRGGSNQIKKVFYGEALTEVQPLALLYTIFDRKDAPFIYLLLKNGPTPFTYLV